MSDLLTQELKATILIVDDISLTRRQLLDILIENGFQVIQAESGAEALELAVASQPQLILLDIVMPDMDGFQACRELKANPSLKDIPVIFISSLDETSSKVKGFDAGGVGCVGHDFW